MKNIGLIEKFHLGQKKGRGCGRFGEYKPWLTVQQVKSDAVKSRVTSRRFGRIFNFFSHGEVLAFYQYDWADDVIEVREQFPLNPQDTVEICEELGLLHPGYSEGGIVMTTDFLVTRKDPKTGRENLSAVQVKHDRSELETPRTYSKLEVERRYWERHNVPWKVVISGCFNSVFCSNLEFFYPLRNSEHSPQTLSGLSELLRPLAAASPGLKVRDLRGRIVQAGNTTMTMTEVVNLLAAHKLWLFDIRRILWRNCRLGDLQEA